MPAHLSCGVPCQSLAKYRTGFASLITSMSKHNASTSSILSIGLMPAHLCYAMPCCSPASVSMSHVLLHCASIWCCSTQIEKCRQANFPCTVCMLPALGHGSLLTCIHISIDECAMQFDTLALQVGGGPTGVELAAEMHDYIKEDMAHHFPSLKVCLHSSPLICRSALVCAFCHC